MEAAAAAASRKEERLRQELFELALVARELRRDDHTLAAMCSTAKLGRGFSKWETQLLSIAFEDVVNAKKDLLKEAVRLQYRKQREENEAAVKAAKQFRLKIEDEIKETCSMVKDHIDNHLIPGSNDPETVAQLHKMSAECQFKVAKMLIDSYEEMMNPEDVMTMAAMQVKKERDEAITKSLDAQESAWTAAKETLPADNLLILDMAVKLSRMFYTVGSGARAYELVEQALLDAKKELRLRSNIWSKDTKWAMRELESQLNWLGRT